MMSQSSNFNLRMLNLWLGLCRAEAGLPSDIRELGYKDKWIEIKFSNSKGETVQPELILSSNLIGHTMLLEWKYGNNFDSDQIQRYSNINSDDLIGKALLSPAECQLHDICLVGRSEHFQRLQIGVNSNQCNFPLLLVSDDGIELKLNSFCLQQINQVFQPKLVIQNAFIPTQLIPFDIESEDWEIAERIIPVIITYISKGIPSFSLDQLAADVMPVWDTILSPNYKKPLKTRIRQIVNSACDFEFIAYLKRDKREERINIPSWKIVYNASILPFDKRSQDYKKLANLHSQFIDALRTGKRAAIQGTMDDILY